MTLQKPTKIGYFTTMPASQPRPLPQPKRPRNPLPNSTNFSDRSSNTTIKTTIVYIETASRELLSDALRPQYKINFISFHYAKEENDLRGEMNGNW